MDTITIDVSKEFGERLKMYLDHYGLAEYDIAKLTNSNTDDIKEILDGSKGIVLKTAESISQVFGIRHFEFCNPKYSTPKFESLPEETKAAIKYRKERGTPNHTKNKHFDLSIYVKIVLESGKLTETFTSKNIHDLLDEEIRTQILPSRITGLFTKGSLRHLVEDADEQPEDSNKPGRKNSVFRLKK